MSRSSMQDHPSLQALFIEGLAEAGKITPGDPVGKSQNVWRVFEKISEAIRSLPFIVSNPHFRVDWSVGKGRFTEIPWLAIVDERVTTSIQEGVYCVYLFRKDMSGFYLALSQGVTAVEKEFLKSEVFKVLDWRADEIRKHLNVLSEGGLALGLPSEMDLRGRKKGPSYEKGTIGQFFYSAGEIPADAVLKKDLESLLDLYSKYASSPLSFSSRELDIKEEKIDDDDLNGKKELLRTIDLREIIEVFAKDLQESGISFGSEHADFVRTFVSSLATKRFVLLTGLSGSGKTQIALKFGQWLGERRCELIPVRPDWTGAEALFGYEDALAPAAKDGRRGWAVPRTLEFMLRAHDDPSSPYLLILDEMNLAHVERYFADVLSGMESDFKTLPNLERDADDGVWRHKQAAPERIKIPNNLFIVGTVNIDETTFMFSPKVLDRANTIEFRVPTSAFTGIYSKPRDCVIGPEPLARDFLTVSQDGDWHVENPPLHLDVFGDHLRTLHRILSEAGFEFGHRVFFEALRFAAIYNAAGATSVERALDRQVMQKLLPRLHGSRRRLEVTLCALARFCFDFTYEKGSVITNAATAFDPLSVREGSARLPISFDKLQRMTRNLRANQFTSFTE